MFKPREYKLLIAGVIALVFLIPPPNLTSARGIVSHSSIQLEWQANPSSVIAQKTRVSQGENIRLEIEPDWKIGFSVEQPNDYSILEFIREGDDIENWHELLTIHNFVLKPNLGSPEEMFNNLKKIHEKDCPGATTWNVIHKDEKSILYEWQAKPCLGFPDQHEIARIIDGKYNRFLFRYTAKVYQLESNLRRKWIERFSQAKVILQEALSGAIKFTWSQDILQPSKNIENRIREMIFQADQKIVPNCQAREVVKIFRETPLLLEEGEGHRWLHHLEKWDIKRCNQLMSYLAWYTFDDIDHSQGRLMVGLLDQAQDLAEKEPAFKELLQYKSQKSLGSLQSSK